jgi:uncharacterized repeat protein (TIGR01451 family)
MRISRVARDSRGGGALAAGFAAIPLVLISAPGTAAVARSATAGTPSASPAPSATARPSAVPDLSISVSDGRTAAAAGDRLTYTVRLSNAGPSSVRRVEITQTLPVGLKFISASRQGVMTAGKVIWHARLPAGSVETFSVTTQLTHTPAQLLRLAAVACAALEGSTKPVVCAAHLDQLPAEAAAAARARQAATPTAGVPVVYLAAGLVVTAAGALVAGGVVRMRRRPRHSG